MAAITETHLEKNETISINGYHWCGKNRDNKGGGIGFLIRNDIRSLIEEPETEPDENTEIKWITVKGITNIAMGVIYGKQESASSNEAEEQFQNLTTQINLYQKTHKVILLGDLNAKIEMKTQDKPGCNQQTSRNGKMLDNLINNTNTTVVNKLSTHQGTWTRVNRKNNKEKSIIDYIIVSKSIQDKVTESKTDDGQ